MHEVKYKTAATHALRNYVYAQRFLPEIRAIAAIKLGMGAGR
jgi:hypothetical protein